MARWKVSFDPHGSPTGGPVAADIRERTAFAAGTTRALFRLADLRKCDQDRFTAPSAGTRSEPVRHRVCISAALYIEVHVAVKWCTTVIDIGRND